MRFSPQRHTSVSDEVGEKGGTLCKIAKMQTLIAWHGYGEKKSWPELQEMVAGREPVVSSWGSYGCLIGMLDQVSTSVLRQL